MQYSNPGGSVYNFILKNKITEAHKYNLEEHDLSCWNFILDSHLWNWLNTYSAQEVWQIFLSLCGPGRPFPKQQLYVKDRNLGQGFGFTWE